MLALDSDGNVMELAPLVEECGVNCLHPFEVKAGNDLSKVPPLLAQGRYFPNGDHGIQPLVSFENLCKFMTLLHEVTGNHEGEFPRIEP